MKVRTRKARIIFANERELWLTPQRKKVAKSILAQSERNVKEGKVYPYDEEEVNRIFEEVFNAKN